MGENMVIDIEGEVDKILKKYNPEGKSPFPFEDLIEEEPDLNVIFLDLGSEISGAIRSEKETNKISIFINQKKSQKRQYFTLGHELGHYFLHRKIIDQEEVFVDVDTTETKTLYRLDNAVMTEIEKQANNFAAYLLMPTKLVIQAWKTINNIEECANLFHVSAVAMSIRLDKLGLLSHE